MESNYASNHPNIRAMLDTYLDEGPLKNKGMFAKAQSMVHGSCSTLLIYRDFR